MNKTLLQYYCGHCNNILKEINTEIGLVRSIEPCPFCGCEDEFRLEAVSLIGGHAVQVTCSECQAAGPLANDRDLDAACDKAEYLWQDRAEYIIEFEADFGDEDEEE